MQITMQAQVMSDNYTYIRDKLHVSDVNKQ